MLELKKIKKSYKTGDFEQHALKGIDLSFRKNEFVAILGSSGSGKTTLLNIIGGLDRYDSGDLIINGKSTKHFKDKDWDDYRNHSVGFIFQSYNLIGHIDVLSNVEMGMTLSGISAKERKQRAIEVLKRVGLEDHIHKKPNQLSGGQMQRVAIARALANDPEIILADEPTGALDSKTSIQIMDLIQEIAKDKLVIMVTHNPDLVFDYVTRVIKVKDGEVLEDSNPVKNQEENVTTYQSGKTSMSFITALKLSLNNIRTKKGRTLLTAFASSIGIIGIALILALSNGFDQKIDEFEESTLSALPIIISKQSMNLDEETMEKMHNDAMTSEKDYPDETFVTPMVNQEEQYTHQNQITKDYVQYLEKMDANSVSGIGYMYATHFKLLQKIDQKVVALDPNSLSMSSLPFRLSNEGQTVVEQRYDILAGKEATNKDELVLVVDSKNRVSYELLNALGFDIDEKSQDKISFDEILNSKMKLVFNEDYFKKIGNYYIPNSDLDSLYNSKEAMSLKVVGIIRLKDDYPSFVQSSGILYTNDLINYVIEKNETSKIVLAQKNANYNVMTGEKIDVSTEEGKKIKEDILAYLGAASTPYVIQIYPKDFETKDTILNYLDEYNKNKKEEEQIVYTDQAELMSSLSSNIMDAVTIVLIAFSSISLIVSSIMIGIIMYISVLERTKEIGILRSLGARKKDISRVFNAETFIIGTSSGLLGILIAWILTIPANIVLKEMTNLDQVASLNPLHALLLITISVILTLIGGYLPAKIASKKDPVIALRTE